MQIINSPLTVTLPRKTKKDKRFILNLNNYRNAHYIILNESKKAYKSLIATQLVTLPEYNKIEAVFTLYPKTKRITDIGNVCSIHEKFFMDALVSMKKLPDDNYNYHAKTIYRFGEIDKENPRVEILIDSK